MGRFTPKHMLNKLILQVSPCKSQTNNNNKSKLKSPTKPTHQATGMHTSRPNTCWTALFLFYVSEPQ